MKTTNVKNAERIAFNKKIMDYEHISHDLDAVAMMLQAIAIAEEKGEMVGTEKALYKLSLMVLDESKKTEKLFDNAMELLRERNSTVDRAKSEKEAS